MPTDTEIIEWLERQHTLHRAVDALYVVDGYDVSITFDGEPHAGPWHGETLREAYQVAMKHWDVTHGNQNLLESKKG